MTDQHASHAHRAAPPRGRKPILSPALVLAVIAPLLAVGALLLVSSSVPGTPAPGAPAQESLDAVRIGCPAGVPRSPELAIANAAGATGKVAVAGKGGKESANLAADKVASVEAKAAAVLTADGKPAAALLASRFGTSKMVAAGECLPPAPERWFTGVGGGAGHRSTLELVNPDAGPAIADITIYSSEGLLDVSSVRGVTVPGGGVTTVDLSEEAPSRTDLAVRVVTSRGRLSASMLDEAESGGSTTRDWLVGQPRASRTAILLGLPKGEGSRTLTIANPNDDQVDAELSVITQKSTFKPVGVEPIELPPESAVTVPLTGALLKELSKAEGGLVVTASQSVTAAVRSVVNGDLSHVASVPSFETGAALVPADSVGTLVLAAPERAGSATVTALSADGRKLLDNERIAPSARTTAKLTLPKKTVLVIVRSEQAPLFGTIRMFDDKAGGAVVHLRQLVDSSLVPQVAPGR
ncbi:DUF5719 family protein [Nocardioides speluncae]|uniref:DUF5719 family protein n=1 Tax=Nocardioides speluncae TaxID=2670337 RepID=UPI000D68FFBD|nr:DUF5719 family protein [Nocardioides speluncae]